MELGLKIKELREKKNLRQEDLGLAVGSKQPRTWGSQIENGRITNLKMVHAIALAKLLDVEPNYFYSEVEDSVKLPGTKGKITIPGTTPVEPFAFYTPKIGHDLAELKGFREKYYYLIEENRVLWKENAYLKSLLIKHQIEVYNTDNQNDTP